MEVMESSAGLQPGRELVRVAETPPGPNKTRSLVPMRHRKPRQPSCRLQLSASPCVRKVSLHLELLSSEIQEIMQAKRQQSLTGHPDDQLKVIGVGQYVGNQKLEMEARMLTDEVMGIVIKLEEDIADTEGRLLSEKEMAGKFKSGLHELRRQQLLSLHSAVEGEHSSCAVDIQELEWHVNYEKRQVAGLESRHDVAVKLNLELRKDINFFEKSKPQLANKAVNEETMLTVIQTEQTTANVELQKRSIVLKDTEKKHEVAIGKINEERSFIQTDLKRVKKALADVKQSILDARAEYDYMVEKKSRSEALSKKNVMDRQLFELKAENTRAAIRIQTDVNEKVAEELDKLMDETRELETRLMTTTSDFETQKVTWEDILSGMKRDLEALEEKYRSLHQEANDLEALIDDKGRDLEALKKRKTELETNVRRMEKDIVKYEDQMLLIVGEIAKLEHLVYAAETELKKIMTQNAEAERGKRLTIENLKQQINQLKQEIQMLTGRYETDLKDLDEIRTHTDWKRDQYEKLIAEQSASISEKQKKVDRLEQKNNEKLAAVAALERQLANLRLERANTETRLNDEAENARSKIVELVERKNLQNAELMAMRFDSDRLHRLLKEMDEMLTSMVAASKRYDARLADLEEIYAEASKQMNWRKSIETELQDRLYKNRNGQVQGADEHEKDMIRRKDALRIIIECLGANCYYNAYLKAKYRQKQNELNDVRNLSANNANFRSMRLFELADSVLTTKFLRYLEESNERSCDVRRAYCSVHQSNTDCQCCRNVLEIRSNCLAMADEANKDGQELAEICRFQAKLRGDAKFTDFKTVPFDVAAELVSQPPISLNQKA